MHLPGWDGMGFNRPVFDPTPVSDRPGRRSRRNSRLVGWPTFAALSTGMLEQATPERVVAVFMCRLDDCWPVDGGDALDDGDDALTVVAERVCTISARAIVARTGWDEFSVAVPATDAGAADLARALIAAAAEPVRVGERTVALELSVGSAAISTATPLRSALASARAALQRTRLNGSESCVEASAEGIVAASRQRLMAERLPAAIRSGAVTAHFQPLVCLRHDTVVGFEALARWEGPDSAGCGPAEFVPVAESLGVANDLTALVLTEACRLLEQAAAVTDRSPIVSINITPEQLNDPAFARLVDSTLAAHDVDRRSLCLELTESQQVPVTARALERLEALKALGVSLAIDDFGAGYSGFGYLTHFPIDYLKLDRALVTGLHHDLRRMVTARAVIGLARTLGITVIAEGVEERSDRMSLVDLSCHLGQGWLWGAAEPAGDALRRLAEGHNRPARCSCSAGDPGADGGGFTVASPAAAALAQLIALERSRAGSLTRLFAADPGGLMPLPARAWTDVVAEIAILEDRTGILIRDMTDTLRGGPVPADAYRFVGESVALAASRRQRLELLHAGLGPEGTEARPLPVVRLQAVVGEALQAETRADAVRESVVRLLTRPHGRQEWGPARPAQQLGGVWPGGMPGST